MLLTLLEAINHNIVPVCLHIVTVCYNVAHQIILNIKVNAEGGEEREEREEREEESIMIIPLPLAE